MGYLTGGVTRCAKAHRQSTKQVIAFLRARSMHSRRNVAKLLPPTLELFPIRTVLPHTSLQPVTRLQLQGLSRRTHVVTPQGGLILIRGYLHATTYMKKNHKWHVHVTAATTTRSFQTIWIPVALHHSPPRLRTKHM